MKIADVKKVEPARPYRGLEGSWYALRTRAQHEKVVRDRLARLGFEQLMPTCTRVSHWHDRKKVIESPLFSGYCFAKFSAEERITVLQIPGTAYIVGKEGVPEAIPCEEIDALKRLTKSGLYYEAAEFLSAGDFVEIIRGPLAGIRGTLGRRDGSHCVIIGVHMIQQGATVKVEMGDVRQVKDRGDGAPTVYGIRQAGLQHAVEAG